MLDSFLCVAFLSQKWNQQTSKFFGGWNICSDASHCIFESLCIGNVWHPVESIGRLVLTVPSKQRLVVKAHRQGLGCVFTWGLLLSGLCREIPFLSFLCVCDVCVCVCLFVLASFSTLHTQSLPARCCWTPWQRHPDWQGEGNPPPWDSPSTLRAPCLTLPSPPPRSLCCHRHPAAPGWPWKRWRGGWRTAARCSPPPAVAWGRGSAGRTSHAARSWWPSTAAAQGSDRSACPSESTKGPVMHAHIHSVGLSTDEVILDTLPDAQTGYVGKQMLRIRPPSTSQTFFTFTLLPGSSTPLQPSECQNAILPQ